MAIKKITLPDNTTQDIQDSRIPGVDSTPTSGSSNLVTSGGVYTALSSKANDSAVVHNTGNETVAGNKTFTGITTLGAVDISGNVDLIGGTLYNEEETGFGWIQDGNGDSVQDALDGKANDSGVVHKAGSETITGAKTFTTSPVLANNISLNGLKTDGTTAVSLIKTDSSNNVIIAGTQGQGNDASTKIYGDNLWLCNYLSDTAGPNIYIGNTSAGSHNQAAGYIYFNSVLTTIRNGFKIGAELGSSADRLNLNFYTSNNGTDPYTPSWNKAFSIKYDGDSEFTGNIGMSAGKYIRTSNSSTMLGISSSNEFFCGPGYEASGGFYLCSDNSALRHRRYSDSSTYNEWYIWDGSNANRSDCNWSVKDLLIYNHIHLPNNKCLYVKDTSSNDVRALYMSTADNLFIGRDLVGLGNTYLYGNEVTVRAGGTNTVLNVTSTGATVTGNFSVTDGTNTILNTSSSKFNSYVDTDISKTGGGVLYLHGDAANGNGGSIIFRSRGDSYPYNGFKIAGERSAESPYTYDRQDLVFYSSNDTDYTCTWIEAMRIAKTGDVNIGTSSSSKNLTLVSPSNLVFSDSGQTLNDILGDIETLLAAI